MTASFPFKPAADTTAAAWVIEGLHGFAQSVVSIVPAGFAAYARVYHPAWRIMNDTRSAVSWSEVAGANKRVVHRQMQWPNIIGSYDFGQVQLNGSDASIMPPDEGNLPLEVARPLWQLLAQHTTTPDQCWFAVWDGFGCLRADVRSAPTFEIPHRQFHLFSASIEAIEASFCEPPFDQSANLWWPADRVWCVATEIDFMTTYVAGTDAAIAAAVASSQLQADRVEPSDGVSWASDTLNPLPPRH